MMPKLKENIISTTKTYSDFLASISKKVLKIKNLRPFENLEIGNGNIEILGPIKRI